MVSKHSTSEQPLLKGTAEPNVEPLVNTPTTSERPAWIRTLSHNPMFQALQIPTYRLFALAEFALLIGGQFYFVALTWLVAQVMGSGLALGSVLMIAAIPRAIFMLVGGAVADRFTPLRVLLLSTAISTALLTVMTALNAFGSVQIWHIYTIAAIFGLVDALVFPALMSMTPRLVPSQHLNGATALNTGIEQIANILGPGIAGIAIAVVGLPVAFGSVTAAFLLGHLILRIIPRDQNTQATTSTAQPLFTAIREGVMYAWKDAIIRVNLLIIAALNFAFIGPLIVGGVLLAERRFGGEASAFGLIMAGWGIGSLIGIALAGVIKLPNQPGRLLIIVATLLGIGLVLIGFTPTLGLAIALMAIMGIGGGVVNVIATVWLQQRTPAAMQGRVMSVLVFAAVALDPLSQGVAGLLADISLEFLFSAAGIFMILTSVLSALNKTVRGG